MGDGVALPDVGAQSGQHLVLHRLKHLTFEPLQLDTNRVVVALRSPPVTRLACVPGALVAVHKLPEGAIPFYEEVRRHLQSPDALKVRVRVPVQGVGEQFLYRPAAVAPRRKADGMDHDQIHGSATGARAKIGRRLPEGLVMPARVPPGLGGWPFSQGRHVRRCRSGRRCSTGQCGNGFVAG